MSPHRLYSASPLIGMTQHNHCTAMGSVPTSCSDDPNSRSMQQRPHPPPSPDGFHSLLSLSSFPSPSIPINALPIIVRSRNAQGDGFPSAKDPLLSFPPPPPPPSPSPSPPPPPPPRPHLECNAPCGCQRFFLPSTRQRFPIEGEIGAKIFRYYFGHINRYIWIQRRQNRQQEAMESGGVQLPLFSFSIRR